MHNSKRVIMRLVNLSIIVVLFFCSSCSKTEYEKKRDLENKTIGQTWRQLEKEKNLVPAGEGKSITPGSEYIGLYFQYFNPLTIDEARELIIYAAETLLHNLNANEKLNELITHPYPMSWIEIKIFTYNPDYSDIPPPGISIVRFRRKNLEYIAIDKKNLETIHKETYEEALEKLKK
ncbi:MAG: hypothetical protein KR126chlam5_00543 [Candidatus Anoxychlamydiales bacterium]|nr:hypothetical protein [Candidatus Anoxychlamydiales bacterium]